MSTARFEMCDECSMHGRIILANGYPSLEICFKKYGLHVIRVGLLLHHLSLGEAKQVGRQLQMSPLPYSPGEVDLDFLYNVDSLNTLQYLMVSNDPPFEALPIHMIHSILHGPVDDLVPSNFLSELELELARQAGYN